MPESELIKKAIITNIDPLTKGPLDRHGVSEMMVNQIANTIRHAPQKTW
jgi:hypothetical protein